MGVVTLSANQEKVRIKPNLVFLYSHPILAPVQIALVIGGTLDPAYSKKTVQESLEPHTY